MRMRRFLPLLLISLSLAVQAQTRSQPIEIDRVVAVVNSDVVTLYELRSRLTSVERQLKKQGTPMPPREELEKQLLERMIIDRIQTQFANEIGMRVSDPELDNALGRIAQNNRMTLADFKAALTKDGVEWGKFREEIRQEMIVARVRDREVDNRITISEGEIDNYLSGPETGTEVVEYALAHIIVRLPEQASPEQLVKSRTRIEQALAQVKRGDDFGKVAALFSDAPDALQGGAMGVRTADRLPALYAEAAQRLKPGEVSDILRSAAGFHILKLIDKRGGAPAAQAIRQTHALHILIKTNEVVSDAEAKRKIDSLKERLDNGGDFVALAKLHSNDLSATKGGDLGWLNQGDTVPEFEKAMDDLPLNKVSEPVRSPFGWHLIKVLERRLNDGGKDRQRLAARNALRERKSDEAYQDWLRQMRDRAHVEYRLEER